MVNPLGEIFGNSNQAIACLINTDYILILVALTAGSVITGGFPLISSESTEFSLNRIFIISLFFLFPGSLAFEVTAISVLIGALLRNMDSRKRFWRYLIMGIITTVIFKTSYIFIPELFHEIPLRVSIVMAIPAVILFDVVINQIFTGKQALPIFEIVGRLLLSYIAILPLTLITIILVIQSNLFGALLAVSGIAGFSFICRSIERKHRTNQQRIRTVSHQDILATRLMKSSSYVEFLTILENHFIESSDCHIGIMTRSPGTTDWILWSLKGQKGFIASEIDGDIPGKGESSSNFRLGETTGTTVGLSEDSDLLLFACGPIENAINAMPSNLLNNLILLLRHTWEVVGHSMKNERSFLAAAVMLSRLADSKDDYTHGHSIRVSNLSCAIGRQLRLSSDTLQTLRVGAILHDIGKLAIPVTILTKRGLLTKREKEIIQSHPLEGARIVSELSGYEAVTRIIRSHHERMDGNGYPDGLHKMDIPFLARIVAVADTFDAITSARSYHSIAGWDNAIKTIREGRGIQFDSRIVDALEKAIIDGSVIRA